MTVHKQRADGQETTWNYSLKIFTAYDTGKHKVGVDMSLFYRFLRRKVAIYSLCGQDNSCAGHSLSTV